MKTSVYSSFLLSLFSSAALALTGCDNTPGSGQDVDMGVAEDLSAASPDLASPSDLAPPAVNKTIGQFARPESVHWDPVTQLWYIGNQAAGAAGDGYITRVPFDLDDTKIERTWVTGLNDPKGLRVRAGKLYVADNNVLASVNIATKAITRSAAVAPAMAGGNILLNDVDVGADGSAYVSDTQGNRILKFSTPDTATNTATDLAAPVGANALNGPNGVLIDGTTLLTVEVGNNGRVRRLNLADGANMATLGTQSGRWDGIEKDGTSYLVSDVVNALLFRFDMATGNAVMLRDFKNDGLAGAADIGWDPVARRLGVPDTNGNKVFFITLP
jgi:hypothetical protein